MTSAKLTCITGIALFLLLVISVRLAAQEQPPSQTNPVPFINQPLVPDAVAPGGKGFTLTVNGTGFVSGSVVNWNGSPLATTFVKGSQLRAQVPASDVARASTASVTVVNPSPGGGTSNVSFVEVTIPTSSIGLSASDFGSGGSYVAVATGDFNGDGKLDLAVANDSGFVSVLLGNGDGTFRPQVDYSNGPDSSNFMAVADFNGDGILDLAVPNMAQSGGIPGVTVLLGNGDGTFQSAVNYSAGANPSGVAVGDFNRDGILDLAVANSAQFGQTPSLSVLLGNGNGTFQTAVDYVVGDRPLSVAVGDFNRDGILDLAVANQNSSNVSILLGNGDGTFKAAVDYDVAPYPNSIVVADFNGDEKLDLAVTNPGGPPTGVSVLLGNGDGTFQTAVNYPVPNQTGVAVGDFNGDGKPDLVVANGTEVNVLFGNGDGTFQPAVNYGTGVQALSVAVGDFNGDGRLDMAVPSADGSSTVSVLLQITSVTLSPPSVDFGVQVVGTKSPAQKVTLTNTGAVSLTISSIAITGTNAGDFSRNNKCGSSLAPGKSCTIGVVFAPTQVGPRAAAVTITDNATGSPQSVPLSGVGVISGPDATLSAKSLTFATQLVGTTSPAQPVTLSNYGTMTLDINSIVASGDYSERDNCGSSLPPRGDCTISVTFAPTQRGHRSGTVTITDNAPNSPQKVHLTGVGTVVKLDPGSLYFGTVIVGQKSSPRHTTLTNTGSTALDITSITITGTDLGDFSQQNNCPDPGYLGPAKSCTITVTFQPTQVGARRADVSVSDDGGGSPQQVSLSGTGKSPCGGPCNQGHCPSGCGCFRGVCFGLGPSAISGNLDTLWRKETPSELLCTARPAIAFTCQE